MNNFHNYNKILVPIDGSECSKKASKHALWIANMTNADIILLHVYKSSLKKCA